MHWTAIQHKDNVSWWLEHQVNWNNNHKKKLLKQKNFFPVSKNFVYGGGAIVVCVCKMTERQGEKEEKEAVAGNEFF